MKTTILKISVFLLLFSLMGTGCEKEDEYEDISLESLKCPCEHDVAFIKKITVENILLFDAEKTSCDENIIILIGNNPAGIFRVRSSFAPGPKHIAGRVKLCNKYIPRHSKTAVHA